MTFKRLLAVLVFSAVLGLALIPQPAATQSPAEDVPAYHAQAPATPLPEVLSPGEFTDQVVQNAYAIAARVKRILYQQPCYCHCDRSVGHGSLLDCFASKHGSMCDVCIKETFYSYEQSKKGKTAAQIREGIQRGDWRLVDTTKYRAPVPAR